MRLATDPQLSQSWSIMNSAPHSRRSLANLAFPLAGQWLPDRDRNIDDKERQNQTAEYVALGQIFLELRRELPMVNGPVSPLPRSSQRRRYNWNGCCGNRGRDS